MTWLVATIIIIVILLISIFIVSGNGKGESYLYAFDKTKDLISTESISGFLKNPSNLELIKSSVDTNDYDLLKEKLTPLLGNTYQKVSNCLVEWNLGLYIGDKQKLKVGRPFEEYYVGGLGGYIFQRSYDAHFFINHNSKEIELLFWGDC